MKAANYFFLFFTVLILKILTLSYIFFAGNDFFGGGNDANYYHAYAIGDTDVAVNAWPVVLRFLNDIDLYSRTGITIVLSFVGVLALPLLFASVACLTRAPYKRRMFWAAVVLFSVYPTVTYLTTDVYRDLLMLFLWLIGVSIIKKQSTMSFGFGYFFLFGLGLVIGSLLYYFRPYLGFSYIFALFAFEFYGFRRFNFFSFIVLFVLALQIAYMLGFLDPLLAYRSMFGEELKGDSNLDVDFSGGMPFFINFGLSFFYQILGFYFVNPASLFVFVVESIPFLLFLFYVVKNRAHSNRFVNYLILFFVFYSSIFVIGNDNLGTATRLRIFSYASVYIGFFVVFLNKCKVNIAAR